MLPEQEAYDDPGRRAGPEGKNLGRAVRVEDDPFERAEKLPRSPGRGWRVETKFDRRRLHPRSIGEVEHRRVLAPLNAKPERSERRSPAGEVLLVGPGEGALGVRVVPLARQVLGDLVQLS